MWVRWSEVEGIHLCAENPRKRGTVREGTRSGVSEATLCIVRSLSDKWVPTLLSHAASLFTVRTR